MVGDPIFTRSQLRDPLFFKTHLSAIMRANRDGRIRDDRPAPKTVREMPSLQRQVDTPPSSEPTPPARAGGSDFGNP